MSTSNPPAERGAELGAAARRVPAALTARPPETVLAEGSTQEVATPLAEGPFQSASGKRVRFQGTSTAGAVADLCSGRADLIEPGQAIAPAEARACARNHLDLLGPLLVGSDAVVVATKNEADVGGDCLTVGQVRDIFRAGSPYANWSQLGFFNIPVHATGSLQEPVLDELFARRALGIAGSLSRSELRSDFIATAGAEATRRQIIGSAGLARADAIARERVAALRAEVSAQRTEAIRAAEARADRQVLAQIAAVNARNRRLKIIVDAEQLERHNAEIDAAAKRAAAMRAAARFDAGLEPRIARLTSGPLARARTPGVVGFVPFTFYEQWEEQLRPVEIWASSPGSSPQEPNCVFPSAQTVSSGHYPLAQQLLVYTTRQAFARPPVREYLLYLIGNAQGFATKGGLVPITLQQRNADLLALGVQPPEEAEAAARPANPIATRAAAPAPSATREPSVTSGVPGVGATATTSPGGATGSAP